MPVEIRELHIKVNVNEGSNGQRPSQSSIGTAAHTNGRGSNSDIVASCVEQVLNILRQKEER
jgi:Family of unknown function (DUF5908)